MFGEFEYMMATQRSDGKSIDLCSNGANVPLQWDQRAEYARLATAARLAESVPQMTLIRRGLQTVVPEQALCALTWQEIEIRICGNPIISVEALRAHTVLDSLSASDPRVAMFWEVSCAGFLFNLLLTRPHTPSMYARGNRLTTR